MGSGDLCSIVRLPNMTTVDAHSFLVGLCESIATKSKMSCVEWSAEPVQGGPDTLIISFDTGLFCQPGTIGVGATFSVGEDVKLASMIVRAAAGYGLQPVRHVSSVKNASRKIDIRIENMNCQGFANFVRYQGDFARKMAEALNEFIKCPHPPEVEPQSPSADSAASGKGQPSRPRSSKASKSSPGA